MGNKEENKGYITKEGSDAIFGRFSITSKSVKYSKLELAWRLGITVAVIVLICLSV